MIKPKKKNKFGAVKTIIDGIKFDSRTEAEYYTILKHQFNNNLITKLELQPKIYLTKAKILYKPDFLIERDGKEIYIDVKGMKTPVFNLKARLWKCYINAELHIIVKNGRVFKLDKIVSGIIKTSKK